MSDPVEAAWAAMWADLQHTSRSGEPVGILPSRGAIFDRHRTLIEAAVRSESAGTPSDELDVRSAVFQAGLAQGRAESAGTLDVERLARAHGNLPDGLTTDNYWELFATEYARLSSSDTEREPAGHHDLPGWGEEVGS